MEITINEKEFEIKDIRFNFGRHVEQYSTSSCSWGYWGCYDDFTGNEIEQILKCIPTEVLEAELERRNDMPIEDNEDNEDDDYYIIP